MTCSSQCVYQSDGICTLESAASAGLPALGGACVHFTPTDAERLGSPHRYYEPGSTVIHLVREEKEPGEPEQRTT